MQPLPGFAALLERYLPAGQVVTPAAGASLEVLWAAARVRWPELPDDRDGFVRHLAARIGATSDVALETALAGAHGADLYHAQHCASGEPRAVELLLAGPFAVARATLLNLRCARELADDVEQDVRALLLVGNHGGHPQIADYAGRGELRSWIASITARIARKRLGRGDLVDDDASLAESSDDPELAYFKDTYREAFETAVREALAAVSVRERNLLRQHHLDRLTLDELSALYGAHRATVARWLAAARERIHDQTRALLVERLALDDDELESVVRLVRSQADISVRRLLGAPASGRSRQPRRGGPHRRRTSPAPRQRARARGALRSASRSGSWRRGSVDRRARTGPTR